MRSRKLKSTLNKRKTKSIYSHNYIQYRQRNKSKQCNVREIDSCYYYTKSNEFIYRHFHCTFKLQPTARRQRKRHNVVAYCGNYVRVHYVTHTHRKDTRDERSKTAKGLFMLQVACFFVSFFLSCEWEMGFLKFFSFIVTYFRRWWRRLRLWRRWRCYVCVFLVAKKSYVNVM